MKKVIALQDLACANCAAKMEAAIRSIDGVHSVSVNFITQKMIIDIDDGNVEPLLKEIKSVCKKVEPDCILKI